VIDVTIRLLRQSSASGELIVAQQKAIDNVEEENQSYWSVRLGEKNDRECKGDELHVEKDSSSHTVEGGHRDIPRIDAPSASRHYLVHIFCAFFCNTRGFLFSPVTKTNNRTNVWRIHLPHQPTQKLATTKTKQRLRLQAHVHSCKFAYPKKKKNNICPQCNVFRFHLHGWGCSNKKMAISRNTVFKENPIFLTLF